MNMRDGSVIATGKGNREWNCSAPHGAGKLHGFFPDLFPCHVVLLFVQAG
jgi:hypothetical protein